MIKLLFSMRANDVARLKVRAGAHTFKRESGVTQDVGVKLIIKNKKFTMKTLVSK